MKKKIYLVDRLKIALAALWAAVCILTVLLWCCSGENPMLHTVAAVAAGISGCGFYLFLRLLLRPAKGTAPAPCRLPPLTALPSVRGCAAAAKASASSARFRNIGKHTPGNVIDKTGAVVKLHLIVKHSS